MTSKDGTPPAGGQKRPKVFCALNLFKWVAMFLMFVIAFMEYYMHRETGVNWMFVGFCVIFGFLLLWAGHVLARHSMASDAVSNNLRMKRHRQQSE